MKRRTIRSRSGFSFQKISGRVWMTIGILLSIILVSVYGWFRAASQWDGQRRYTFIWEKNDPGTGMTQSVGIFSLEPRSARAVYLRLPGNTLVTVPYGYSTYPLAAVYQLGQLDATHGGGALLTKSIEGTAGMAIDGYIVVNTDHYPVPPNSSDALLSIKRDYATWWGVLKQIGKTRGGVGSMQTNISLPTWYHVWQAIRQLRNDQLQFIDLEKTTALIDTHFPDGSLGQAFDRDAFDTILGDRLQDSLIRSEPLTVDVVNASGADGVAGQVGVMLERLGGHVIGKSTAKTSQRVSCQFFVGSTIDATQFSLLRYLQQVWKCEQGNAAAFIPQQSDVRIIIGEDFVK